MSARDVLRPVQRLYNATLRKQLPRKLAVLNGVTTRQPRLLDATDHDPSYEAPCISSLRSYVRDDDDVVVIGGGFGVSAVAAARAGADVDVTVFEAAREQFEAIQETLEINTGTESITPRHAIVGEAVDAWGSTESAAVVEPTELPEADVMEIDAEGAEMSILQALPQRPRVLIVESHDHLGSPTKQVWDMMQTYGYRIETIQPEDSEKGVHVLTGVRK